MVVFAISGCDLVVDVVRAAGQVRHPVDAKFRDDLLGGRPDGIAAQVKPDDALDVPITGIGRGVAVEVVGRDPCGRDIGRPVAGCTAALFIRSSVGHCPTP